MQTEDNILSTKRADKEIGAALENILACKRKKKFWFHHVPSTQQSKRQKVRMNRSHAPPPNRRFPISTRQAEIERGAETWGFHESPSFPDFLNLGRISHECR